MPLLDAAIFIAVFQTVTDVPAYSVVEAKNTLPKLIHRALQGEEVVITRHGKPVARLVPTAPAQERNRADVIRDMLEFGKGRKLDGMSIREMVEEGRRF